MNVQIMSTVITATENINVTGYTVFLGGAIDMGTAVNWQQQVIDALYAEDGLVILNPRREHFESHMLEAQIEWELSAMESADVVLMWFPAAAQAPISLLETGLYMRSGKLLVGAESGYFRRTNLELTCQRYAVPLYATLDELIARIKGQLRT
jgi:hypothetical protein